ncbi:MAG: hypothetical protein M3R24_12375 [Chloroflexota bacterium]|nr:hypothetical protein [Chloroflexota bacterium]
MEPQLPRFPLPAFAPLCKPMVFQLLYYHANTRSALEAITRYPALQEQLLQEIADLRPHVYADIAPLVAAGRLTTQVFVDLLRSASPSGSKPTEQLVSFWRSRGVLHMDRRGYPDPQSVAAILLARRIASRAQRGWLPAEIPPSEPDWWCWRQDGPAASLQICPIPLPANLPPSAVIWTVWAGARWLPNWIEVDGGVVYVPDTTESATVETALGAWQLPIDDDVRTALRVLDGNAAGRAFAREVFVKAVTPLVAARLRMDAV